MTKTIAIRMSADGSEQTVPVRLFAAARTSKSVPLTYYSAPQHISVRIIRDQAHAIAESR